MVKVQLPIGAGSAVPLVKAADRLGAGIVLAAKPRPIVGKFSPVQCRIRQRYCQIAARDAEAHVRRCAGGSL
jgi:hypothetical protein